MRPILLIYERVRHEILDDVTNPKLIKSQQEKERKTNKDANTELAHNELIEFNTALNNSILSEFGKKIVNKLFTDDSFKNNLTKEFNFALTSLKYNPQRIPYEAKTVTWINDATYYCLENNSEWCWVNASFQALASLKCLQNFVLEKIYPHGFQSFAFFIEFLKKLNTQRNSKDAKNLNTKDTVQKIYDDMNINEKEFQNINEQNNDLPTIVTFKEKKYKYNSFKTTLSDFKRNEYDAKEKKYLVLSDTVKSNDPAIFIQIITTLFENTDEKHENYMSIDNKIFGFKEKKEVYCLNSGESKMLVTPLSPVKNKVENVDYNLQTDKKVYIEFFHKNKLENIANINISTLVSVTKCIDEKNCIFYTNGHESYNHLEITRNIYPISNKIIHLQIIHETSLLNLQEKEISQPSYTFKTYQNIDIPETINVIKEGETNSTTYTLKSLTYHGGGLSGGHHTAICKRNEDWFYFSDTHCYKFVNGFTDVKEYASNGCQHLFYECD